MAKAPVIRIPRPRVSEIELCAWVAQAAPGAVLEYHRGYLALDRTAFGSSERPLQGWKGRLRDRPFCVAGD